MPRRLIGALVMLLTSIGGHGDVRAADLLLRNARLIDGTGAPPRAGISVLVRDGEIAEIGTVEVGKRADLLVVRGDPLEDLRALRTIEWTIKDGTAHTPAEWMGRR